jgi:hypothetical protein
MSEKKFRLISRKNLLNINDYLCVTPRSLRLCVKNRQLYENSLGLQTKDCKVPPM